MSSCAHDQSKRLLARLRQRLEFYTATLLEWQQALDEANREIGGLAPCAAIEAAAEIGGIQKSYIEFNQLKAQVDAGWALYRRLSENPAEIASLGADALAPLPLPTSLQ